MLRRISAFPCGHHPPPRPLAAATATAYCSTLVTPRLSLHHRTNISTTTSTTTPAFFTDTSCRSASRRVEEPRVLRHVPHPPPPHTDPATSAQIWEMDKGIFAGWVSDVLGYHTPLGMREEAAAARHVTIPMAEETPWQPTPPHAQQQEQQQQKPTSTESTVSESSSASSAHFSPSVRLAAESAGHSRAAAHRDARNTDGSCSGGDRGSTGPFFIYGPLASFEVSPVFEWAGCLWQWRPLEVREAAARTTTTKRRTRPTSGDGPRTGSYYLVPFLLVPSVEVPQALPHIHSDLRDLLLSRACGARSDGVESATFAVAHHLASSAATLWTLSTPTPLGSLAVHVADPAADAPALAVFERIEHAISDAGSAKRRHRRCTTPTSSTAYGSGGGDGVEAAVAPLVPPATESWEAIVGIDSSKSSGSGSGSGSATDAPRESGLTSATPYVRVFCTDGSELTSAHGSATSRASRLTSSSPSSSSLLPGAGVPTLRRNAMGGGLAELLLAVDRYAALIARDELTLSAACWATLCDTKSWWTVQRLRTTPREVERDLVAATAAHRRWQQRALSRNRTMVGKSSHGIQFNEYPALARWVGR